MLGTTPGDCIPYFDLNRFAELLIDGKEPPATTATALNASQRAVTLIRTAEGDIVEAIRTKQQYDLITLQDLVRDYQVNGIVAKYGYQLVSLIADIAWKYAIQRKRYPEGTPQGDDPAIKRSEESLKKLREGSRIFVIEGMPRTDGAGNVIGTYTGQDKPNAGLVSGHTLHSNVGHPVGLWGNPHSQDRFFPDGPSPGWGW